VVKMRSERAYFRFSGLFGGGAWQIDGKFFLGLEIGDWRVPIFGSVVGSGLVGFGGLVAVN
jgi:hypothetical protein